VGTVQAHVRAVTAESPRVLTRTAFHQIRGVGKPSEQFRILEDQEITESTKGSHLAIGENLVVDAKADDSSSNEFEVEQVADSYLGIRDDREIRRPKFTSVDPKQQPVREERSGQ
jgi:hypothetical protein